MQTFILLITVVFVIKEGAFSWRPFEFCFNDISCTKYSQIANFVNCTLSKLPKEERGLCFNMHIAQRLKKPKLDFLIETTRPNKSNFVLVNLTRIDACQFFENRGILNILQIVRREFDKYANMPRKCPIAKDTNLYVKDLILDPNNFPPYVPETDFIVTVKLWEDITPVFDVIVKGNVKSRNRRKHFPLKIQFN